MCIADRPAVKIAPDNNTMSAFADSPSPRPCLLSAFIRLRGGAENTPSLGEGELGSRRRPTLCLSSREFIRRAVRPQSQQGRRGRYPQETTMGNLILDSLEIQNFRTFQHLRIEKLGRVNLITGKNNVGKTSLLE